MIRTTDSIILEARYPTAKAALCILKIGNSTTAMATTAALLIASMSTPIIYPSMKKIYTKKSLVPRFRLTAT